MANAGLKYGLLYAEHSACPPAGRPPAGRPPLSPQVDDDDKSDLDDDELEAIAAAGQTTEGATTNAGGDTTTKEGDKKETKSVRMSAPTRGTTLPHSCGDSLSVQAGVCAGVQLVAGTMPRFGAGSSYLWLCCVLCP